MFQVHRDGNANKGPPLDVPNHSCCDRRSLVLWDAFEDSSAMGTIHHMEVGKTVPIQDSLPVVTECLGLVVMEQVPSDAQDRDHSPGNLVPALSNAFVKIGFHQGQADTSTRERYLDHPKEGPIFGLGGHESPPNLHLALGYAKCNVVQ